MKAPCSNFWSSHQSPRPIPHFPPPLFTPVQTSLQVVRGLALLSFDLEAEPLLLSLLLPAESICQGIYCILTTPVWKPLITLAHTFRDLGPETAFDPLTLRGTSEKTVAQEIKNHNIQSGNLDNMPQGRHSESNSEDMLENIRLYPRCVFTRIHMQEKRKWP